MSQPRPDLCHHSQHFLLSVARHSSERYSTIKVFWAAGIVLNTLGLDFNLARILTTYLMELPNSRMQELEGELSCTRVVDGYG